MVHLSNIPGAGKRKGEKKYVPAEYTALKLLEFMIDKEHLGPFSVYRLMRFRAGSWQRRDRIRLILDHFTELGWVEAVLEDQPRYRVTEEGKIAYRGARGLLDFTESVRFRKARGPRQPSRRR